MRRKRKGPFPLVVGGVFILLFILFFWRLIPAFFSSSPVEVVEEFITYEQEGDFGSAWDLFHSTMQTRFSKNAYITERSHIYMSHYAVTTFTYEILDEKKLQTWKTDQKTFENVHQVQIQQTFHSKFGTFSILQDVFVVKEEEEWKILWEFK